MSKKKPPISLDTSIPKINFEETYKFQIDKLRLLSPREVQVLNLFGIGYVTKDIARKFFLSMKTIESYKELLKEKLNLPDHGSLIRFCIQYYIFRVLNKVDYQVTTTVIGKFTKSDVTTV